MKRRILFALAVALVGMTLPSLRGQTLRLFVLTGQSNGLGTPAMTITNMVLGHTPTNWVDPQVPFFWDNTADGTAAGDAALGASLVWTNISPQTGGYYAGSPEHWGPEVGFARMLWDAGYRDFGIVKASRGGGGNSYWDKTNPDHHMYDKVVSVVSNAVVTLPPGYTNCQTVGLLYLQGESNDATEADQADTRLAALLDNLRTDLPNAAGMKAVLGQIASDASGNRLLTTQRQAGLAASRADIGFARSAGLAVHNLDGLSVHYSADSLVVMGERMAAEAMRVGAMPEQPVPAQGSLYAWYRADHGVLPASNATVSRWSDLSSGAATRDLTQIAGAPPLMAGNFAAAPQRFVVRFDGASQHAWATVGNFGTVAGPRTVVLALRVTGTNDGFLFDGSTGSGMSRAQVRSNMWQVGVQAGPATTGANGDTPTAPRRTGAWQFHEFSFIPTNNMTRVRHWIDGTNAADFFDAETNGLGGLILAANVQAQRHLPVDIGEVLVYQAELFPAERSNLLNALQARWTPAFDPVTTADVYAWYAGDGAIHVGADHYSVTTWMNAGTAATNATYTTAGRDLVHLTGSPQKVYLRLANGTAAGAVRFDGNDGLWAAKSLWGILTNDRTIVAVTRISNAVPQGFLFDSTSTTPGYTRALVLSNNWHVSTTSGLGAVTTNVTTGVWQVHSFVASANSGLIQHFINGAQAGSIPIASPSYLSGLMIGANVAQGSGIWADVAEFLVYNSALSNTARTNVEAYLSNKWFGVMADTNAPPMPAYLPFVRVFTGGVDGYTCFRIPAIVTTGNGTLIAMSDGRIGSCGDIPTPLDLVIKRSLDNGVTWGPLQVVTDYGSNPGDSDDYPFYGLTNITRVASGDAALLLDRTNGRIWTLYDNGGVVSGARKIKLEMKYSDDNGETWSPRIDVEAQNPGIRPNYGEFLAGPGNGIQLSEGPAAGRLVFPVYSYGNPSAAMVIYSDDHGATWQRSANAVTNGGEIQVAELPGGLLLASMRDNGFSWSGVRTFASSSDGGVTWGAPYTNTGSPPTLPDPQCQGNIYRLTTTNDSNASRLVHANAASASSRVNMTLRISYDEGQTWPVSNQVYAAGSAYSSVTKLANGDVGLLFEKDPYGNLDFARRSIFEITGGGDSLPAYDVWAGQHFTPAQLSDPLISGPSADPDGDGQTNKEESISGTDPLSASSFLQLNVALNDGVPELSFDGISNKSYTVQYRNVLNGGTWQTFTNVATLTQNATTTLPVTVTNNQQLYRLVTPQLP